MRTGATTAALVIGLISSAVAVATPLGIPKGTPIKSLRVKKQYGDKSFVVVPPKANPAFVEYIATATPPHGVCGLTAITKSSPTFDAAYDQQERIEKLLSTYGKPHHVRPSDRADWLNMAPVQGPLEWNRDLPNHISSIVIETVKEAGGYQVELHYFYDNYDRCVNWEPRQNRDAL
jgi:hypothetical protein